MKSKDLLYLSIAIVLFVVTGILAVSQLGIGKSLFSREATVEVVAPISSELNQNVLTALTDGVQTRDFTPPIDLQNGLGNPRPFNPL